MDKNNLKDISNSFFKFNNEHKEFALKYVFNIILLDFSGYH